MKLKTKLFVALSACALVGGAVAGISAGRMSVIETKAGVGESSWYIQGASKDGEAWGKFAQLDTDGSSSLGVLDYTFTAGNVFKVTDGTTWLGISSLSGSAAAHFSGTDNINANTSGKFTVTVEKIGNDTKLFIDYVSNEAEFAFAGSEAPNNIEGYVAWSDLSEKHIVVNGDSVSFTFVKDSTFKFKPVGSWNGALNLASGNADYIPGAFKDKDEGSHDIEAKGSGQWIVSLVQEDHVLSLKIALPDSVEVKTATIYAGTLSDVSMHLYSWEDYGGAAIELNGAWPGAALSTVSTGLSFNGQGIYTATVKYIVKANVGFILNNGGDTNKSGDQTLTEGAFYYATDGHYLHNGVTVDTTDQAKLALDTIKAIEDAGGYVADVDPAVALPLTNRYKTLEDAETIGLIKDATYHTCVSHNSGDKGSPKMSEIMADLKTIAGGGSLTNFNLEPVSTSTGDGAVIAIVASMVAVIGLGSFFLLRRKHQN